METDTLICVDAGTTNTRVWLTAGERVIAAARASVGVRDSARDGSPERLCAALHDLIGEVSAGRPPARAVVAAGMITSSLGLADVPHVTAPASLQDLIEHTERHAFPSVTELPVLLVPGVRSGPLLCTVDTLCETDMMRGEETLCVGLSELGLLSASSTLLNLGSHWKLIRLDEHRCIAASLTSLSGELIQAAQTQTILASAVPAGKPDTLDQRWLAYGMREARRAGVARALFCVRLLEQRVSSSPEERLAFLLGVYVAADLDALLRQGSLQRGKAVVLSGGGAVAKAWAHALGEQGIPVALLSDTQIEQGFLTGLLKIAAGVRTDKA